MQVKKAVLISMFQRQGLAQSYQSTSGRQRTDPPCHIILRVFADGHHVAPTELLFSSITKLQRCQPYGL
jgi:hypothetical protein